MLVFLLSPTVSNAGFFGDIFSKFGLGSGELQQKTGLVASVRGFFSNVFGSTKENPALQGEQNTAQFLASVPPNILQLYLNILNRQINPNSTVAQMEVVITRVIGDLNLNSLTPSDILADIGTAGRNVDDFPNLKAYLQKAGVVEEDVASQPSEDSDTGDQSSQQDSSGVTDDDGGTLTGTSSGEQSETRSSGLTDAELDGVFNLLAVTGTTPEAITDYFASLSSDGSGELNVDLPSIVSAVTASLGAQGLLQPRVGGDAGGVNFIAGIDRTSSNTDGSSSSGATAVSTSANVTNLSDPTLLGAITIDASANVSGLKDSDIPDTITASNYLLLTGGSLTGGVTTTNFYTSGSLTVGGNATTTSAGDISTQGNLTVSGTATIGTLSLGGNQSISGTLAVADLTSGSILFAGTAGLLSQSNSELFWDNSNDRLGIGTTTPLSVLDIYRSNADATISLTASSTAGVHNAWTLGADLSDGGKFKISSSTALGTNDRFVIDGNGNIGIGESVPGSKLSVSGNMTVGASYDTTAAAANSLLVQGILGLGTTTPSAKLTIKQPGDAYGGGFQMIESGTTDAWGMIIKTDESLYFGSASDPASPGNFTDRVVFTNTGYVGIGTSTPFSPLQVAGTGGLFQGITITDTTAAVDAKHWIIGPGSDSGSLSFATLNDTLDAPGERVTITSGTGPDGVGVVGIGTTTPNANLAINQPSGNPAIEFGYSNIGSEHWLVGVDSGSLNGSFVIASTFEVGAMGNEDVNRLTINPTTGNVGLGASTTPWRTLSVDGTVGLSSSLASSGPSSDTLCVDTDTFEVFRVSGACTGSSERFKENIETYNYNGLEIINALRPVSYNYINDKSREHIGFIAEEVNLLEPRLIQFELDGFTPRGVNYGEVTAVLTKSVQELNEKIENLSVSGGSASASLWRESGESLYVSDYESVSFGNARVQNVKSIDSSGGKWSIGESGKLSVSGITVGDENSPNGITLYDKTTKQPYCFFVDNGEPTTTGGRCEDLDWGTVGGNEEGVVENSAPQEEENTEEENDENADSADNTEDEEVQEEEDETEDLEQDDDEDATEEDVTEEEDDELQEDTSNTEDEEIQEEETETEGLEQIDGEEVTEETISEEEDVVESEVTEE